MLQIYPTPWDCVLVIWLASLYMSQMVDNDSNLARSTTCLLSSIALGVNLAAVLSDGRTRENLYYTRDNVFGFVLLLLIGQLFEFLNMHPLFGPWTVIIRSLVMDVVKFLFVLLLFIGGFTMQMCVVYKPVYGKARVYMPTDYLPLVKDSILQVFNELFFACFGLTNRPNELTDTERNQSPKETFYLATFVFALYEIIIIIVLINLLIAMMSNTYTRIEERSETEWKFGRASLIWRMTKTDAVPNPVNVLTTFITICKVVYKSRFCCCLASVSALYKEMSYKIGGMDDEEEGEEDIENPKKSGGPKYLSKVVPWKEIAAEYRVFKSIHADAVD